MNEEAFATFSVAYRAGLIAANADPKEGYGYSEAGAATVADKMLAAIAKHPLTVNYTGGGFKRACKALGIKYTRKAIFDYLGMPT